MDFFCPFDRRNPHCTLLADQPQQPLIQLREAAGRLRHKIIPTWHFKRASYEHRLSGHTVLTADQLRTSEWLEAAPFLILSQTWTPFMSNYIQIIFTNKRALESRAQQLACGYEGRKKKKICHHVIIWVHFLPAPPPFCLWLLFPFFLPASVWFMRRLRPRDIFCSISLWLL